MSERIIRAEDGNVFRRIHDQIIMGDVIYLGYDYSTGVKRLDLPKYYEEIEKPDEDVTEEVEA